MGNEQSNQQDLAVVQNKMANLWIESPKEEKFKKIIRCQGVGDVLEQEWPAVSELVEKHSAVGTIKVLVAVKAMEADARYRHFDIPNAQQKGTGPEVWAKYLKNIEEYLKDFVKEKRFHEFLPDIAYKIWEDYCEQSDRKWPAKGKSSEVFKYYVKEGDLMDDPNTYPQEVTLWAMTGWVHMQDQHTDDGKLKAKIFTPQLGYQKIFFRYCTFYRKQMESLNSIAQDQRTKKIAIAFVKEVASKNLSINDINKKMLSIKGANN